MPKPSYSLLDEYGLTEYLYDALKACEHPTFWKQGLTHSIASLYKLRDRDLLTGPPTGKPYSQPFALSEVGRELISRIERGLHKPEWLSEHQTEVLRFLFFRPRLLKEERQFYKFRLVTLNSLECTGYISCADSEYVITPLGREAWQERSKSEVLP